MTLHESQGRSTCSHTAKFSGDNWYCHTKLERNLLMRARVVLFLFACLGLFGFFFGGGGGGGGRVVVGGFGSVSFSKSPQ